MKFIYTAFLLCVSAASASAAQLNQVLINPALNPTLRPAPQYSNIPDQGPSVRGGGGMPVADLAAIERMKASLLMEPVRVQLLTDNPDPAKGDQLAFEGPAGCVLAGAVNDARLVVINRKVCPSGTTNVTMVVPLDRQASVTEAQALKNSAAIEWLTESSRNYYLFPVEAAVDAASLGR